VRLVLGAILDAPSVQPSHHHAATEKCSKWGLSRLAQDIVRNKKFPNRMHKYILNMMRWLANKDH